MFDFVFGDQKFPSNISSRESMAGVSRLPCKEVCGAGSGDVVDKLGFGSDISEAEGMAVVSSPPPQAESYEAKIDTVVSKPQNDISIFATPLPESVLEQRQRKLSRESGGSTGIGRSTEPKPPTCRIIEEGREWYGYRDEGIRQAAAMFGVTGPWIRPNSANGVEDVDADKIKGTKEQVRKEKPFWHGNGRKVRVKEVEERWMCVGDDEFGIGEELIMEDSSDSEDSVDSDDGIPERSRYSEERPWWSVRWKNVFRMLGCGVLA